MIIGAFVHYFVQKTLLRQKRFQKHSTSVRFAIHTGNCVLLIWFNWNQFLSYATCAAYVTSTLHFLISSRLWCSPNPLNEDGFLIFKKPNLKTASRTPVDLFSLSWFQRIGWSFASYSNRKKHPDLFHRNHLLLIQLTQPYICICQRQQHQTLIVSGAVSVPKLATPGGWTNQSQCFAANKSGS